jgi:hypothetical protein
MAMRGFYHGQTQNYLQYLTAQSDTCRKLRPISSQNTDVRETKMTVGVCEDERSHVPTNFFSVVDAASRNACGDNKRVTSNAEAVTSARVVAMNRLFSDDSAAS